jgi:hypothetical protein
MTEHHAHPRDPRSIVTPDAFEVSSALLGMPLAKPMSRFWAILIDLAVIGVITAVTKSFALVLGVVAAFFFIRVSLKRTEVPNSAFGRAMRFSLGCLGLFIGVITAIVWVAVGFRGFGGSARDTNPQVEEALRNGGVDVAGAQGGLGDLLSGIGNVQAYRTADDVDEAVAAATTLALQLRGLGQSSSDVRSALQDLAPADAPWSDRRDEVIERALQASRSAQTDTAAAEEAADTRLSLLDSIAGDTLAALGGRIDELEGELLQSDQRVRGLRTALSESEARDEGGLFSWLRDIVDELGFGFGWASLYLTVTLSWWKGQTVGKRIMKVRVLRLDGEPITWWTAFERAGGYAAGFATGLLGFAQVFWDANRQAIHDRIVGTVVVVEGAPKVTDWEDAL